MPLLDRDSRRHLVYRRRLLETIVLALIAGGVLAYYFLIPDRPAFLFFFFVPVCIGAALSGSIRGLLYALLAVVAVVAPILVQGTAYLAGSLTEGEVLLRLSLWAGSLGVSAYLIGFVSEVGGNRLLVLGLGSDAITAVERERKRMAFDIHDGVAQTVNTALMQADILEMLVEGADQEIREQALAVRETVAASVVELRTMIGNLRPACLTADEFPQTLSTMVEEFRERTGIKVELNMGAHLERASDSVRICIYRVVQEALSNIEQHAEASRAWIGLNEARGGVFLAIRDDGVGFDLREASQNGHHGLAGIQERVWLLTGRVQIDTSPAQGTTIRAYIPRYTA